MLLGPAGFVVLACAAAPEASGAEGGPLRVDRAAGVVRVRAEAAKQGAYEVLQGAIEYVLVSKGGKDYESLFVTEVEPEALRSALMEIGLEPGQPAGADSPPEGSEARILVEYERQGKKMRRAVDELVLHARTRKPLEPAPWVYTGSLRALDPEAGKEVLQCSLTKSLVGLHYTDPSALFQNPRREAAAENLYRARLEEMPEAGTRVDVVFEKVTPSVPEGTRRVRAALAGRVQGVGLEVYAQRRARLLGLGGRLRRTAEDGLDLLVEGPREAVERLLSDLRRAPRAARLEKLEVRDQPPRGDLKDFRIER